MKIYRSILGNIHDKEWEQRLADMHLNYIELDQWTAQKSRFMAHDSNGEQYAIAMRRGTQLRDGDVIEYDTTQKRITLLRLRLNDIMVIEMGALTRMEPQSIISTCVELGHAIGNQHWPAVVSGSKVYVPLVADRKVMQSVMNTHRIEHIAISFRQAEQITPYLSPQEIRHLLAGANNHNHDHATHHQHATHADHTTDIPQVR